MNQDGIELISPELQMLRQNKIDGYNYRYRRRFDWDENYELYRDKVITNRLTQRQSVNLPLMKSSIQTLLKDIDDMPVIYFENLDNDKEAELYKNEYWQMTVDHNKMEINDLIDKKQAMLYGRTFDQWQIMDGWVKQTIQDPYDILIQRFCDPKDINTSRFLIHTNIFVPITALDENPDYDKEAVKDLQDYYSTYKGLLTTSENRRLFIEKQQRLADMGLQDVYAPVLGETFIMLTLHFVWRDHEPIMDANNQPTGKEYPSQIFLYVEADNMRILMKKPLEEVIGTTKDHFWQTHFPYTTWAGDIERQDFWSDGVADIIRTPNKVLNSWFAQMVENRTLRNFGMQYYNSNIEGFVPQTMEPIPFGWYGIPVPPNANIQGVVQPIQIPSLDDSLDEMNFIMTMIQTASGATATQEGVPNQTEVTLGEVQLMVNEAKERVKGMSKLYTQAWEERGMIFAKLIEAASDKLDGVTIFKKGRNTANYHKRDIQIDEMMTPAGYNIKVWSQDEKNAQDTDALNKLNAVKANMPDNPKLTEIYDRKLLEFAGLKPEEINGIMQYEEEKAASIANGQAKPKSDVPTESMQLPYQLVPDDIKRQMEAAFGFEPSKMGAPQLPSGQPQLPGSVPQNPGSQLPQLPAQIPSGQQNASPTAIQPATQ